MNKIALCIGNNHFSKFPDNSLQGCQNDADDAAAFLQGRGFTATVLKDATEADSKAALAALKPGGVWPENSRVVIWTSSHGSQIENPDSNEPDGLDEVTCCADFDGEKGCITDKWWGKFLAGIPASSRVYLMADTCHSADLTRELGPQVTLRYLANPKIKYPAGHRPRRNIISLFLDKYVNEDASYPGILFSGCDENGTSADACFNGRSNGAFTYFVLSVLRKNREGSAGLTNHQLSNQINLGLKSHGYAQHSHLQCGPAFVDEAYLDEEALAHD